MPRRIENPKQPAPDLFALEPPRVKLPVALKPRLAAAVEALV